MNLIPKQKHVCNEYKFENGTNISSEYPVDESLVPNAT